MRASSCAHVRDTTSTLRSDMQRCASAFRLWSRSHRSYTRCRSLHNPMLAHALLTSAARAFARDPEVASALAATTTALGQADGAASLQLAATRWRAAPALCPWPQLRAPALPAASSASRTLSG